MRRLIFVLCTVLALVCAPVSRAQVTPWFAQSVGNATQVISVVGVGGSSAKMDVYQRTPTGWQAIAAGIPAFVGSNGMAPRIREGGGQTPTGIFSLDFAFGTAPNPGGGLQYVQVGPNHWWDGDSDSPTYNTMQVCEKSQCPFSTDPPSGTENLQISQYEHAVVMGVNKNRVPDEGSAYFLHATDGGPTAGCVAIDDATLVKIMQWLKPGALIAIAQ
jgi:L,D-peptidoglycan transpeptidase YkuD (ErfK/YbiS/YcfS/YnhG family)